MRSEDSDGEDVPPPMRNIFLRNKNGGRESHGWEQERASGHKRVADTKEAGRARFLARTLRVRYNGLSRTATDSLALLPI